MTRLYGYIIASLGFIIMIFLLNYHGLAIPLKELWFVLGFFILVYGAFLIIKSKFQRKRDFAPDQSKILIIAKLKETGEKIKVTLDNCELKTRSFKEEIVNDSIPSRIEMLDAHSSTDRNYKTAEIHQTYIVFLKKYGGLTYKFISQPTTQSSEVLRMYIDKNRGIDLYIDRQNPTNYFFDLPFL